MFVIMRLEVVLGKYIDPQVLVAFRDADKAFNYIERAAAELGCGIQTDEDFSLENDARAVYYLIDGRNHIRYKYCICSVAVF